jgi:hypothetical protein
MRPFYGTRRQSRIPQVVQAQLRKHFHSFVDHERKTVRSIMICSYEREDYRSITEEEERKIRSATDALVMATICPTVVVAVENDNRSMAPPSSDRYDLLLVNLIPGDDYISVRAGSLTIGAYRIGELTFPQPFHLGGSFGYPSETILNGLGAAIALSAQRDDHKRLLRSLEWFRHAHTETHQVSNVSKVVMMATAFEILLDVPDRGVKKQFIAEYLDQNCSFDATIREVRTLPIGGGKTEDHSYSRMAWWAWDFYNLRNTIVHGDEITPDELRYDVPGRPWVTQLMIADIVFYDVVVRQLYRLGLLGDKLRDVVDMWGGDPQVAASFLGLSSIHRALGWSPAIITGDPDA